MAKRKPPKRMFKDPNYVSSYETNRLNSADKRLKVMSREHEDILQNIEFAVVTQYREDRGIDDRHIDEALRIAADGGEPSDRRVSDLIAAIGQVRSLREDVTNDLWRTALLAVRDSVKRHSNRKPGDRGYLTFVEPYIR